MIEAGDKLIFPDTQGPSAEGLCIETNNAGAVFSFPKLKNQDWTHEQIERAKKEGLCHITKGAPNV